MFRTALRRFTIARALTIGRGDYPRRAGFSNASLVTAAACRIDEPRPPGVSFARLGFGRFLVCVRRATRCADAHHSPAPSSRGLGHGPFKAATRVRRSEERRVGKE